MLEDLRRIKKLLDEGLITQEDYDIAKNEILEIEKVVPANEHETIIEDDTLKQEAFHGPYDPSGYVHVSCEGIPSFDEEDHGLHYSSKKETDNDVINDAERKPVLGDLHKPVEPNIRTKSYLLPILALLLVLSIGGNVFQFISSKSIKEVLSTQETTIADFDKQVNDLQYDIQQQEDAIVSLNKKVKAYESDSNAFYTICKAAKTGKIGRASGQYYVDTGLIVVGKNETSRKITLTTAYSGAVTVSVDYSGNSARLSFDQDEWYGSTTTLTVKPSRTGVTVATFKNNLNSESFKVIIIVTD